MADQEFKILEIEHRHSDYGPDAGGYSVLRYGGAWIGRIDGPDARKAAEELIARLEAEVQTRTLPSSALELLQQISVLDAGWISVRAKKALEEVHTRTPQQRDDYYEKWENAEQRAASLADELTLLEAKNKSLGTWNKEQGDALQEARLKIEEQTREIEQLSSALRLAAELLDDDFPSHAKAVIDKMGEQLKEKK